MPVGGSSFSAQFEYRANAPKQGIRSRCCMTTWFRQLLLETGEILGIGQLVRKLEEFGITIGALSVSRKVRGEVQDSGPIGPGANIMCFVGWDWQPRHFFPPQFASGSGSLTWRVSGEPWVKLLPMNIDNSRPSSFRY